MVALYKALVLPIIEYASIVWMSPAVPEIKLIEQIQRKFTRMLLKIAPNPSLPSYIKYNKRLVKLGLLTVEQRLKISQILMAKKLKTCPNRVPTLNDFINLNISERNVRNKRAFEVRNVNSNFAQRQPLLALQQTYNTHQHLINEVEAPITTRKKLKDHFYIINNTD